MIKTLAQVTLPIIVTRLPNQSVQKVGLSLVMHKQLVIETQLTFPRFWVGVTVMALCMMNLRMDYGGVVERVTVAGDMLCTTMVVVWLPVITLATSVIMLDACRNQPQVLNDPSSAASRNLS